MMKKTFILGTLLVSFVLLVFSSYAVITNEAEAGPKSYVVESKTFNKCYLEDNGRQLINIEYKIKNKADLEEHKKLLKVIAKQLKETAKSEDELKLIEKSVVTVTFTEPISLDILSGILKNSNTDIKDYEVKFLNAEGVWVTGAFRTMDMNRIEEVCNEIIEEGSESKLTFIGVTSARVYVNLLNNSYNVLASNPYVYLADLTDVSIRFEEKDFNNRIKIRVPDLAWELDIIN